MEILYQDKRIIVAVKPAGVLATDVPGGMPELLRQVLGEEHGCVRPVHRLDAAVGGVMLFARSRVASSILSRQVSERSVEKEYAAVVHGSPEPECGVIRDLLFYDTQTRRAEVRHETGPGVKEAALAYEVVDERGELALVRIRLQTGRTHQIRVQFASRGVPIVGDRKYGRADDGCDIALWSRRIVFDHPETGTRMAFSAEPPETAPWTLFD